MEAWKRMARWKRCESTLGQRRMHDGRSGRQRLEAWDVPLVRLTADAQLLLPVATWRPGSVCTFGKHMPSEIQNRQTLGDRDARSKIRQ